MSGQYQLGDRPSSRPFPIVTWLVVVAVIIAAGGGVLWHLTGDADTEIQNAGPVTRTVVAPER